MFSISHKFSAKNYLAKKVQSFKILYNYKKNSYFLPKLRNPASCWIITSRLSFSIYFSERNLFQFHLYIIQNITQFKLSLVLFIFPLINISSHAEGIVQLEISRVKLFSLSLDWSFNRSRIFSCWIRIHNCIHIENWRFFHHNN